MKLVRIDEHQRTNLDLVVPESYFYHVSKRVMDITGGLLGMALSVLPILILAHWIKKDGGPIFYAQRRVGKNGKIFKMYKLRSMVLNADDLKDDLLEKNELHGGMFKIKDDPRVTEIGRKIRHYSLDEMPQFWNVVKGDMSLVGPRPCLERELDKYSNYDRQRLTVKPGISGLWQVSGRSNLDFAAMIELDLKYIRERSIRGDIRICLRTIWLVLSKNSGAY